MALSPPDDTEGLSPEEKTAARKKEIIRDLRALVNHPGWQYICTVLEQHRLRILYNLQEAATMDELIRVNMDLREARTYSFLVSIPDNVIAEFSSEMEG